MASVSHNNQRQTAPLKDRQNVIDAQSTKDRVNSKSERRSARLSRENAKPGHMSDPPKEEDEARVPLRVAALGRDSMVASGNCRKADPNSSMTLYRDTSVLNSESDSSDEDSSEDEDLNNPEANKVKKSVKYRDSHPVQSSSSSSDSPDSEEEDETDIKKVSRSKRPVNYISSDSEDEESDDEETDGESKSERQTKTAAATIESSTDSDSSESNDNNLKLKAASKSEEHRKEVRKAKKPTPVDSDSSEDSSDTDNAEVLQKPAVNRAPIFSESPSESDTDEDCLIVGVEKGKSAAKPLVSSTTEIKPSQRSSSETSSTSSSSSSESGASNQNQVIKVVQHGAVPAGRHPGQTVVLQASQLSGHLQSQTGSSHGKMTSATSMQKPVAGSAWSNQATTTKPMSTFGQAINPGSSLLKPKIGGQVAGQSSGQQQVKVIHVSAEASRELTRSMNEKAELSRRLEQQQKVLTSVNVKHLPDGGQKLRQQIADMTSQLGRLDIKIQHAQQEVAKQAGLQGQKVTILPQRHTVSGQVLPPGVKQTKLTDHAFNTQLPSHVYQQMFAANPQAMTLYGGRMTAARLQQVGDVTAEAIERIHKQLETCPSSEEEVADPKGVKVPLMVHQRQALAWLNWREQQHPPGGILADDMGLGKTLTMISLIALAKSRRDDTSQQDDSKKKWLSKEKGKELIKSNATLVVCPASLVHQWHKEIERRCRRDLLTVVLYHGPNRDREQHCLADVDVVLTTYSIISREVGVPEAMKKNKKAQEMAVSDKMEDEIPVREQPMLLRIAWERIILDEAHSIKNCKSLTAMSVCRLRALYRWALTGTPIQNDLLDMYSLLRFLRCSPFDELKVWKRQVDNKSANGTKRLNTLMKSLLLRRTKDQIDKKGKPLVSLPPRRMFTHDLELCEQEREVYEKIFSQSRATMEKYLERHEEKLRVKQGLGPSDRQPSSTNPWSKQDVRPGFAPASQMIGSSQTNQSSGGDHMTGSAASQSTEKQVGAGQMLLLLLRLRQCCSHLSLMKDALDVEGLETDGVELDIVQQMQGLMLQEEQNPTEPSAAKKPSPVFEVGAPSAKIKALLKHIREIKEQSPKGKPMKSVVVSQWTKMLEVAKHHLLKEGLRCCTIKGDIPPKKRMELVDAFNTDPTGPEVMLLSLRAGGVGLNLVGGNHLFLIDMHWNPALEQQASDRIYRMGQTKDVSIHRFICKDTVEEKILQLQKRKLSLASNVLTGGGASANKLTLADLRMLFGLDNSQRHIAANQAQAQHRPIH